MPVIKSAIKRMRQSEKRRASNYELRSRVKTEIKKVLVFAKEGKKDEASKSLDVAYSVIDTALKKHIIKRNNAARKKSRIARLVAGIAQK